MPTTREKMLKKHPYPKNSIRVNPELDQLEGVVLSRKHQEAIDFFQQGETKLVIKSSSEQK